MSSSSTETHVDLSMPQLGTSIAEGTVIEWRKAIGDRVERDEPVCDISTDKVDSECPSPVAGVLAEILVDVGETVEVGTVLARIAVDGAVAAPSATHAPTVANDAATARTSASPIGAPAGRFSPVVRRIAAQHGIDLARVHGTGRAGRVTKRDVLALMEAPPSAAERPLHSESPYRPDPPSAPVEPQRVAASGGEPQELSRMRRSIGAAMRRSLDTAATCTTIVECEMTLVERRRRELGLTALPLLARHVMDTLPEFPDLNATLDEARITRHETVNLGIAVSLGGEGLIVPVINDAQELSELGLAGRIKDLAGRARSKQLAPEEVEGATFTITSPGAYGALIATPVINLPQVAILDMEAIVRRPVVVVDGEGGESIAIRSMVNLCMSWDHRAMDGVYAARFLTALRWRIEGRE